MLTVVFECQFRREEVKGERSSRRGRSTADDRAGKSE